MKFRRPTPRQLIPALCALLLVGVAMALLADRRNALFEFCTTKAYGWPLPWKVEY